MKDLKDSYRSVLANFMKSRITKFYGIQHHQISLNPGLANFMTLSTTKFHEIQNYQILWQ
jgi:hypothetical protein